MVWFEPERVMPGTELAGRTSWLSPAPINLPASLSYQQSWRLLNLGNADALQYTIDTLSDMIRDWHVDIYRQVRPVKRAR